MDYGALAWRRSRRADPTEKHVWVLWRHFHSSRTSVPFRFTKCPDLCPASLKRTHCARLSLTPERPCGYTRLSAPHALSLSRRHPCNTLITLLRRSQATHFQRRSSSTHHTLFSHIRRPIPRFRGGHGATRGGRYSQLPGRRPPGTHRRCAGGCPGAHLDVAYCAPAVGEA